MKEVIKSIAVNIGIGLPWFIILYFSNPTLMANLNYMEILSLGFCIAICKELVVWGLKNKVMKANEIKEKKDKCKDCCYKGKGCDFIDQIRIGC